MSTRRKLIDTSDEVVTLKRLSSDETPPRRSARVKRKPLRIHDSETHPYEDDTCSSSSETYTSGDEQDMDSIHRANSFPEMEAGSKDRTPRQGSHHTPSPRLSNRMKTLDISTTPSSSTRRSSSTLALTTPSSPKTNVPKSMLILNIFGM
jgi:hypothetical protein